MKEDIISDFLNSEEFQKLIKYHSANISKFDFEDIKGAANLKFINAILDNKYDSTKGSLKTYYNSILKNLKNDYFRKRYKEIYLEEENIISDFYKNPAEYIYIKEIFNAIFKGLDKLKNKSQRIVIILKIFFGLSDKEIEEITHLSSTNISTLSSRAIQILNHIIDEDVKLDPNLNFKELTLTREEIESIIPNKMAVNVLLAYSVNESEKKKVKAEDINKKLKKIRKKFDLSDEELKEIFFEIYKYLSKASLRRKRKEFDEKEMISSMKKGFEIYIYEFFK